MNIYGLLKKNTVDTNKGRFMLEADFYCDYVERINNIVQRVIGPVDIEGYMNNDCVYVAPYNGRYGKGFIVCKPEYFNGRKSTKYMRMYYYIEMEK